MPISTLFFDLDDTLYPSENGLWDAIRERIHLYMLERLKIPEAEIPRLRKKYYETYGTTLRGLQLHHQLETDDYLAYVHDLPLKSFLHADPGLRTVLLSLPQPKWIFTNADAPHARRVLLELGLADCFQGIIDIHATYFTCKPEREAYVQALHLAGEQDPLRCCLFEDSARNLAPARELGFFTVLVGSEQPHSAACCSLHSLHQLREKVPELWIN
jgi:putative hydrolase of the HAD superfamily